jgi:NodT family efflux transporter outer membrane factor (OMF) lipoprotein
MLRRSLPLALSAVVLTMAGCALQAPPKPEEIRALALPHVEVPGAWKMARGETSGAPAAGWLATFGEPQLDALVREADRYNADLQVAAARVEQAAGYAKLAGATIYPAVNLLARGGGKLGGDQSGLSGVGLFASWELDIWGRVRAERAAGAEQYEAAVADAFYARQSIAATTAKSFMLAVEARLQLAIAADIVRASEQAIGLARDRLRVGASDEYDVALAEANLATARDAARQLALGYEQARRALETLVGRYPAAELEVPAALPRVPGPVPVGLPSELLERRPDVIAAERRIAAAFHRVAEAKAARLPKFALTAGVTSISSELFVLQNHANPVLSLGANLAAPIFNGYALEAQVDIRNAEQQLAIAEYGRVGLRAFGEVETALSSEFTADEREAILARSVASNARTLELAQVRYRVGSGDLRTVLQQNVALYGARTALLHVQTERLVQRVNLHLALGGSFVEGAPGETVGSASEPTRAGEIADARAPRHRGP